MIHDSSLCLVKQEQVKIPVFACCLCLLNLLAETQHLTTGVDMSQLAAQPMHTCVLMHSGGNTAMNRVSVVASAFASRKKTVACSYGVQPNE